MKPSLPCTRSARPNPRALFLACLILLPLHTRAAGDPTPSSPPPDWLQRPLPLLQAINLALEGNSSLHKARADLEAAYGIVMQTRAIAIPKLGATGNYQWTDQLEDFQFFTNSLSLQRENQWSAGIRLVQSVYEGGRIRSSLRSARLTREQAELQYQAAVADVILQVRTSYYDVLLAAQQIRVQEESLQLLDEELKNAVRREAAGTVPRFNVLRAEVELANARPALIRTQNAHRIAKINLANLLGYDVPHATWFDIPLTLADTLEAPRRSFQLEPALQHAVERRPELAALRKHQALRHEGITTARAGNLPSFQVFAGHNWRSATFEDDLSADISGWNAGAQLSWNFFDGMQTYGKIREAKALKNKADAELEDATRRVALEVRTAYSSLIEAGEVLDSQVKASETAEEALRLANVRAEAGAGIQLDVLAARTALTQTRTTRNVAQRDYLNALARLERAIGLDTQLALPAQ